MYEIRKNTMQNENEYEVVFKNALGILERKEFANLAAAEAWVEQMESYDVE